MTVIQLAPPPPKPEALEWKVTLHDGKTFLVKAHAAFESDTRIYFTDLGGTEMSTALNNGKIVSSIVASFDQDMVLYYAKAAVVAPVAAPRKSPRKKS